MATTDDSFQPQQRPPKDMILFLGGSSKKHNYLRTHFTKYSETAIECQNIYTSSCHKHGYEAYTDHFKHKNIRIVGICPLMDSLIPFTDSMNKLWGLPHNNTATSQIRRNKALMHSTIRDNCKTNSVRYAPFFSIKNYLNSQQEFESKMKEYNLTYPIVIKPPTSGGTDGVRLCYTYKAAQKVVKRYLNQQNGEKNMNITMMAQEFLNGEEFVVNTVSYNSHHKFTDIWRAYKSFHVDKTKRKKDENNENINEKEQNSDDIDEKNANANDQNYPYSMLYDYQQFECEIENNEKIKLIVEYVENILNVLGVKYGCGHCEVMYLPDENKVCLIELNARMHGDLPRANSLVTYDQMTCLALAHCNSNKFVNDIPKYYNLSNESENINDKNGNIITVRAIFLRSKVNGKMDMNKLIEFKNLKTFKTFARTLFDGVNYWLEYQFQIAFCKSKLEEINNNNSSGDNENEQDIENKKDEYLEKLNKSLKIIDKIEKVEKTIDLISCPGTIVLQGKLNDIKKDYQIIRALEDNLQNGLFIPI